MFKSVLSIIQALLFVVSSFSVSDSKFKTFIDTAAVNLTSKADFGFNSVTAEDVKISENEKRLCREWYEKNILTDKLPAYDFTVGGKSLQKNINMWEINIGEESPVGAYCKGGKTTIIQLKHKNSSLKARVQATIYEEYATCEWTVFIKNEGSENSPVIKSFYGMSGDLGINADTLYFSKGSMSNGDDFELRKTDLNYLPMFFNANGGRNGSYMPFFNISGKDGGAVISVGWTGQWATRLAKQLRGVKVKAGQEKFKAYLTPGEEVRTPLICLSFYEGGNGVKGFNTLRKWETDCVCPDDVRPLNGYVIANEFSKLTTDDFIEMLERINPVTLENTDYFWMDAGWYECKESWWDGVGNWVPDSGRFPEGLKPLGDKIKAMGKRFLLWYEPERVREGTYLYEEGMKHKSWIIKINDDLLWNLGDEDACRFLSDYIGKSLVDNGVTMYRQDFNFNPLQYWEKADKELYGNRKGICENHYVTNLYAYLDSLCGSVEGLIIDNCASGGRRLDIEMTRRSLPLWRSDYNCGAEDGSIKPDVLEATQAMTYGLSCWIPYSGTNRYFHSQYASRTAILTSQSVYEPDINEYAKYAKCSEYMAQNYYPLTYGGLKDDKIVAMQFGGGTEGTALIYIRENVKNSEYNLKLSGLYPDKEYKTESIDGDFEPLTLTGAELMDKGIQLKIAEAPKAMVIFYSEL